ncbi:hypothetical protein NP233_g12418 [Leucocoprinus birnbaumii]|uniref:DUF4238 domain-containing protein n=1 Tax=Leucocoprinus birnbaumii TaxID=56174 RepID=A0AAD5YN33_9AGAR|nr:hypothetical protein NP233_g12418 [Leucocoprinus birnbaumii]
MLLEAQASEPTGGQYHHYIPRFILRSFLETHGPPKTKKQRSRDYLKSRKGIETELLHVYDLSTRSLRSLPVSKAFGEVNLYADSSNTVNLNHVEKKLALLENQAAQTVADIRGAMPRGTFSLTRCSLEVLRKFVFVMHYRKPDVQASYFDETKEENMKDWVKRYMQTHNIASREGLWLHGLAYILEAPHPEIIAKSEEIVAQYGESRLQEMIKTRIDANLENWFAVDYESLANSHFLGVWEAAPGCEFILGSNSFGLWEGLINGSPDIHRIFIVGPKLALILRCCVFRESMKYLIPVTKQSSLLDIKMATPSTRFHNSSRAQSPEALRKYRLTAAAQKDIFTYEITKLTEAQTRAVNEVILLNLPVDGSLVFQSKENAVKAIRYHIFSPDPFVQAKRPEQKFRPLLHSLEDALGVPRTPVEK